jgi:hypothetical protein
MVAVASSPALAAVPCLWPGETIVCLGAGPSLTQADVDACRGRARVIAIKHAIEKAPWADVLYGAGKDRGQWWQRIGPTLTSYAGLRYTLDEAAAQWATVLQHDVVSEGLDARPTHLRTGHHSGYQAINLAVHLGAAKVVLLGYDMQRTHGQDHWFGAHHHRVVPPFELFLRTFPTIVEPLRARGVTVVNASRETALDIFPRLPLEEALA